MSILIAIVSFVIILVILVVAHEFGHFITAKSRGVGIIEFGIGFPPRIFGIKKGITIGEIERAFKLTHKAGIKTIAAFMVGNIGDTENTIKDSIELAKQLKPTSLGFSA